MKRVFSSAALILALNFIVLGSIAAQTQPEVFSTSGFDAMGNKLFVDQAGLELLQTASPLDNFIDENSYYIGPYDVLSIQGKGSAEFSYRAIVVNASGDISVPQIGALSLKGLSLAEAKQKIIDAFSSQIRNTSIYVTLDQPRPVSVHIGGNIPNPGRYIVPAGTRFDALVTGFFIQDEIITPLINQSIETLLQSTSQRPSYSGLNFDKLDAKQKSESEIQNEDLSEISRKYDLRFVKVTPLYGDEYFVDLAAYFNSGNPKFAPFIRDGDYITLTSSSPNRPTVSISGAVNSPFTGSYREDDTFVNLLSIAGGFSPDADTSFIVLLRLNDSKLSRQMLSPSEFETIRAGDQIIVPYKKESNSFGSVRIEGEVELPGTFIIHQNKTSLGEIIQQADGLTENALPNAAYLIRNSFDNRGVSSVLSTNLSLLGRSSDQFLEGYDYLEFEQALDPNRMAVNLNSLEVLENTILQSGDQIYIPRDEKTISILGQVNVPGFYSFNSQLSVDAYLNSASGLTIAADSDRIFIIKAGSRAWLRPSETEIESGDILFVDRIPFEDISTGRDYAIQVERLKTDRTRLILAGISAATSIVTAYVAVRRLN